MGKAEGKLEVRTLHLGTIANAGDGELALKASRYTGHDVLHERARQAPGRTGLAAVVDGGNNHAVIGQLEVDQIDEHHRKLTLGALCSDLLAVHCDRHAADRSYRLFANTRHIKLPFRLVGGVSPGNFRELRKFS